MANKTVTIDVSRFRYSWWWKSLGWLIAFGNLAGAAWAASQGDAWQVMFNGSIGGFLVGTLLERDFN